MLMGSIPCKSGADRKKKDGTMGNVYLILLEKKGSRKRADEANAVQLFLWYETCFFYALKSY